LANDCNMRTYPLQEVESQAAESIRLRVITHSRTSFATPRDQVETVLNEMRPGVSAASADVSSVGNTENVPQLKSPAVPPASPPSIKTESIAPPAAPVPQKPKPENDTYLHGRGGSEHKYLQHLIARLGEERQFRAVIEEPVGTGRVD